jgi:hypothetical protein
MSERRRIGVGLEPVRRLEPMLPEIKEYFIGYYSTFNYQHGKKNVKPSAHVQKEATNLIF